MKQFSKTFVFTALLFLIGTSEALANFTLIASTSVQGTSGSTQTTPDINATGADLIIVTTSSLTGLTFPNVTDTYNGRAEWRRCRSFYFLL